MHTLLFLYASADCSAFPFYLWDRSVLLALFYIDKKAAGRKERNGTDLCKQLSQFIRRTQFVSKGDIERCLVLNEAASRGRKLSERSG